MPSKITITRQKNRFGFFRNMNINLNGVNCGYLKNGQSITLEKAPGIYELVVKVEVYKSETFKIELNENETREIVISNSQQSDSLQFVFFIGLFLMVIFNFMGIKSTFVEVLKYVFLSIPLVQMLYYFTIAKGKFIAIHQK